MILTALVVVAWWLLSQFHGYDYWQAKRTCDDFRFMGTRIGQCTAQVHHVPATKADVLRCLGVAPLKDGWGHPWVYVRSDDFQHFRLISAGRDGVLEHRFIRLLRVRPPRRVFDDFAEDIVFEDGEVIQIPRELAGTTVRPSSPEGSAASASHAMPATSASNPTRPEPTATRSASFRRFCANGSTASNTTAQPSGGGASPHTCISTTTTERIRRSRTIHHQSPEEEQRPETQQFGGGRLREFARF